MFSVVSGEGTHLFCFLITSSAILVASSKHSVHGYFFFGYFFLNFLNDMTFFVCI